MVYMLNGYLLVPYAADGSGDGVNGGFALLDVSNPSAPTNVFTTDGDPTYRNSSAPDYAGGFGEPHGFTMSGDILCHPINTPGGIEFWDFSDMGDGTPSNPPAPTKISRITFPGLEKSGYNTSVFSVAWQGDYAYVAGTGMGLYIVDVSDPAKPILVDRGTEPNPIPPSQLGNFPIGFVHPVGNLLVLSKTDNGQGLAVLDIGDPANPALLYTGKDNSGYATTVNGAKIYGGNGAVWDLSNYSAPSYLGTPDDRSGMGKGGYSTVQDNFMHVGMSNGYLKADISGVSPITVGKVTPPILGADYDFAISMGNLVFIGDDHGHGSLIYPHQTAMDTTGPEVNMVVPRDGALNQPLTSRIGLTFTDQVKVKSIDTSSIIVRPFGTTPALSGTYTVQTAGIVNFWPDLPLLANTTYEVVVPIGSVEDWAGNLNTTAFVSGFSTGGSIVARINLAVEQGSRSEVDATWNAIVSASHESGDQVEVSWDFGDGSAATAFSTNSSTTHTFSSPAHYNVVITARLLTQPGITGVFAFTHTVHRPISATQPRSSATLLYDSTRDRIWTVNRDNDTVTCINADTLVKLFEVNVGDSPQGLAQATDGNIWVINRKSGDIYVLNPVTGSLVTTYPLPYASQPGGIVFPAARSAAYVTLEATGQLLEIDHATGQVTRTLAVGPGPRGIASSPDGSRLFITRFISPDDAAKIIEVDPATLVILNTIDLAIETTPDTEASGRGLPNYLGSPAVSPDGHQLWIPSKKDNIGRGVLLDGLQLTFENTVRPIVSRIDLATSTENLVARVDLNDRSMPVAVTHSDIGDYAFVLEQGSNSIDVLDAYNGAIIASIEGVGKAPHGITIDHGRGRLFVHNFLSRDVVVYDITAILNTTSMINVELATIPTVATETLPANVLLGKQLFYDGRDPRLTRDNYMSCAACHDDGGHDGRVWDFTGFGEGLRNTIPLTGRSGTAGHGRVHSTGNFDEIQDFERQIRILNNGTGLMDDADFNQGTRSEPLGDAKTGLSSDLDALAAYLESLSTFPRSPHRQSDGSQTAEAIIGKIHFDTLNCASCHGGPQFTDSPAGFRHDVGTITASSGERLGGPLDGFDTPTLRDVWDTAPYLHDGSAPTLHSVFTTAAIGTAHAEAMSLSSSELDELVAYLMQIDGTSLGSPDVIAPFIATRTPADNSGGLATDINLRLIFNEPIVAGSGFITIKESGTGTTVEAFDVSVSTLPELQFEGTILTIDPVGDLAAGTSYYVEIDATAIDDIAGNSFEGITSSTAWNFATPFAPPPTTNLLNSLVVTNSSNDDHYSIQTDLGDDDLTYGDRGVKYKSIAANASYLVGADYIRTANADRSDLDVNINFTLAARATVYVSIDDRVISAIPDFFATYSFTDTGDNIVNQSNYPTSLFSVYETTLAAGTYDFTAQKSGLSPSMYTVMAQTQAPDYEVWALTFPDFDLINPAADLDGDGLSNYEELVWGLNPTIANASNPAKQGAAPPGGSFSYTRRKQALSGVTYTIWTSYDRKLWTEDTGAIQMTGPAEGGVETVEVTLSAASRSAARLFYRVIAK